MIGALLSRTKVYVLNPLTPENIRLILRRALEDRDRGLGKIAMDVPDNALEWLSVYAMATPGSLSTRWRLRSLWHKTGLTGNSGAES